MNRSMKQMLSALLAVAMVAALLVVPSVAADKLEDGIYKLTADTTPVTVKVGETKEIAVKAEYAVSADTYAVVADTDVTATADTAVATAAVAAGKLTITGVAAGTTDVVVTVKGTTLQATIPVTVETAAPTTGIFTLDITEEVKAGKLTVGDINTDTANLGDEGFFTIIPKASNGKIEESKKTFEDDYVGENCYKTGGGMTVAEGDTGRLVTFSTGAVSTVKVWWTSGSNGCKLNLKDASGADIFLEEGDGHPSKDDGSIVLTTIENVPAGACFLGGTKTARIYKVEVNIANTPVPVVKDLYQFDATTDVKADDLATAAEWGTDKVLIKDEVTYDDFFTFVGVSSNKVKARCITDPAFPGNYYALELGKVMQGYLTFTVPEGKTGVLTMTVSSNGGSNSSDVRLTKDTTTGTVVEEKDKTVLVTGTTATTLTYEGLTAGTYFFGSPEGGTQTGRGARVLTLTMNFGAGEDPKPPVDPDPEEPTVYTVTADTKVTVTVDSKKTVNVTVDPAGEIYAVSADTSIATVTVANGKVTVTGVKAGKTTVTVGVVDGIGSAEIAVTVNAKSSGGGGSSSNRPSNRPGTNEPATSTLPFTDVKVEDWFYDSVKKAFEKGLMKGTDETTFAPNASTTRAMVATVLFRMDGEKKTDVAGLFNDVEADSWYTDAVAWAAEKGIVLGYDETTFAPNDNVTREQLVVMLYRYAAVTEKSEKDLSAFADAASVSEWATEAMTWAVEKGIILGKGNSTLDPQGVASRAEVCTMLVRFLEMK